MRGRYPGRCRQSRSRASWLHVRPANPCVERPVRYAWRVGVGEPLLAVPGESVVDHMCARTIFTWNTRPTSGSRALPHPRAPLGTTRHTSGFVPCRPHHAQRSANRNRCWIHFVVMRGVRVRGVLLSSVPPPQVPQKTRFKSTPPVGHSPPLPAHPSRIRWFGRRVANRTSTELDRHGRSLNRIQGGVKPGRASR